MPKRSKSSPAYRVFSTEAAQIHELGALAVSRDGSLIAAGTLYGTVQIWGTGGAPR